MNTFASNLTIPDNHEIPPRKSVAQPLVDDSGYDMVDDQDNVLVWEDELVLYAILDNDSRRLIDPDGKTLVYTVGA